MLGDAGVDVLLLDVTNALTEMGSVEMGSVCKS